jgi:hypothetical protein
MKEDLNVFGQPRRVPPGSDEDILRTLLEVDDLPRSFREKFLSDAAFYTFVHIALGLYRENKRLEFDLEEARSEVRLAEDHYDRLTASLPVFEDDLP